MPWPTVKCLDSPKLSLATTTVKGVALIQVIKTWWMTPATCPRLSASALLIYDVFNLQAGSQRQCASSFVWAPITLIFLTLPNDLFHSKTCLHKEFQDTIYQKEAILCNLCISLYFVFTGYSKPFNIRVHTDATEGSSSPAEASNLPWPASFTSLIRSSSSKGWKNKSAYWLKVRRVEARQLRR